MKVFLLGDLMKHKNDNQIFITLKSWTKIVEKNANFLHINFNFPQGKHHIQRSKPSLPLSLSLCCFEGWTITQPFFQQWTNTDEGEVGGQGGGGGGLSCCVTIAVEL